MIFSKKPWKRKTTPCSASPRKRISPQFRDHLACKTESQKVKTTRIAGGFLTEKKELTAFSQLHEEEYHYLSLK